MSYRYDQANLIDLYPLEPCLVCGDMTAFAAESHGGQVQLPFCIPRCLREFFERIELLRPAESFGNGRVW